MNNGHHKNIMKHTIEDYKKRHGWRGSVILFYVAS